MKIHRSGSYFLYSGHGPHRVVSLDIVQPMGWTKDLEEWYWSYDNETWNGPLTHQDFTIFISNISNSFWFRCGVTFSKESGLFEPVEILFSISGELTEPSQVSPRLNTTIIKNNKTSNIWNPYAHNDYSIHLRKTLSSAVSDVFGHNVVWFHTEPDSEGSVTFQTFSLHKVTSFQTIKVILKNDELPSSRPVISEWLADFEEEFQINIDKSEWETHFPGTTPRVRDFVWIPLLNRMYSVNSQFEDRDFMNTSPFWTLMLVKYQESSNITKDTEVVDQLSDFTDLIMDGFQDFEFENATGAHDSITETELTENTIEYNRFSKMIQYTTGISRVQREIKLKSLPVSKYYYKMGISDYLRYSVTKEQGTFISIILPTVSRIMEWVSNNGVLARLEMNVAREIVYTQIGQGSVVLRKPLEIGKEYGLIVSRHAHATIHIVELNNSLPIFVENAFQNIVDESPVVELKLFGSTSFSAIKYGTRISKDIAIRNMLDMNPDAKEFEIIDNCDAVFSGEKVAIRTN